MLMVAPEQPLNSGQRVLALEFFIARQQANAANQLAREIIRTGCEQVRS
jgi:hypothetical protein